MGSVGDAPPGGPKVHTTGGAEVLQPRSIAIPLAYVAPNNVSTALGVATDNATARFPPAQLETSAEAAVVGLGCSADGSPAVVVVLDSPTDVVVVDTVLDA
jgi:hypothetical protein